MNDESGNLGVTSQSTPASTTARDSRAANASHRQDAGGLGTRRVVAALFMVVGAAWNAGLQAQPFHPVLSGVAALAVHVLPLAVLMLLVVPVLRSGSASGRLGRGVSIAAAIALVAGVFSILFSATHPHATVGIHDVNDLLPFVFLDVGALMWLVRMHRRVDRARG